jgi:hypothetical protein
MNQAKDFIRLKVLVYLECILLTLRYIEREDYGSYLTEREKDEPSRGLEPLTFCYPGRRSKSVRL